MMNEREIFQSAIDIPDVNERHAYLDQACGTDAALRAQVEQLLRSHETASQFLETPAAEQLAPGTADETDLTTMLPKTAVSAAHEVGDDGDGLQFLEPPTKPGSFGRLAHYDVLEVLGRGAFGIVLKAFDEKLHRMVAIKVMNTELAATSPPRKRFVREAQSSAKVRHENIVAIHAVEDQPLLPYLVMEYIPGGTLQQRLDQKGPLGIEDILRIGQQIALGLAAAHAQGLIHRDIKPANILLESGVEERVKITDFGLARATDDASLTQSGLIAGTPMYMAPEQAKGQPLDHRTDLFSLGSVLYTMASGRPPFRAPNTIAVLKRVCEDTPRPITEVIPETPPWLCDIIARLQAKEPEDRFQSAKEVADVLGQHLAHWRQPHEVPLPATVRTNRLSAKPQDEPSRAVIDSLRWPARGLIATACFNWMSLIFVVLLEMYAVSNQMNFGFGPIEMIILIALGMVTPVILIGALKMLRGESYGWCVAASVMAIIIGPGYLLGWPFGIWSLIVLTRPEVREAFRRRAAVPSQTGEFRTQPSRGWSPATIVLAIIAGLIAVPVIGVILLVIAIAIPAYQAASARGMGTVVVQSDDPFVTAVVDDRRIPLPGREAVELRLPPGNHVVAFWKDNEHLGSQTVQVQRGQNHVARWPENQGLVLVDVAASAVEWEPLFNGKDLSGWMTHPQQPGNWRVEEGAIVGAGSVSHLFTQRDDFHDFEFRGEVRLNRDGNSGVFLRTPFAMMDPNAAVTSPPGYEVQLVAGNQIHPARTYLSGGLIPLANPNGNNLIQEEKWYKFRVKAVGDKFETWIDDVQTVSAIDPLRKFQGGHLALQVWSAQSKVEFRNLEVRNLSPSASNSGRLTSWQTLFNGRDLTGWHHNPQEPSHWTVENGMLISRLPKGAAKTSSFLLTDRTDYRDFHVRIEAKINDGGDSGLFFRFGQQGIASLQTQITAAPSGIGALLRHADTIVPSATHVKPDTWFTLEVIAQGTKITVLVDGQEAVSWDDPNEIQAGPLALESGFPGTELFVRKVEVGPVLNVSIEANPTQTKRQFASDQWIDVLPLIDPQLDKWGVSQKTGKNAWRMERGELVVERDTRPSKLILPLDSDWPAFECELEFTRRAGNSGLNLNIPTKPGECPLVFDPPNEGGVHLGAPAKGKVLKTGSQIKTGQRTTVHVAVRRQENTDRIAVAIDGAALEEWTGDRNAIAYTYYEGFPNDRRLSLWIHGGGNEFVFHRIRVKLLDGGIAESLRPATASAVEVARDAVAEKERFRDQVRQSQNGGQATPLDVIYTEIDLSEARTHFHQMAGHMVAVLRALTDLVAFREREHELISQQVSAGQLTQDDLIRADASLRGATARLAQAMSRGDARAPFNAADAKTFQHAWAKHLGVPVEYTDALGMQFRLIPPGTFLMGATDDEIKQLSRDLEQAGATDFDKFVARFSGPQHRVRITQPYYLAAHEVTIGQYRKFIETSRHIPTMEQLGVKRFKWQDGDIEPNRDQRAVIGLSWDDAVAYCRWASQQHGLKYDLPTEAQWEFACRAGTTTMWSFGDDVAQLADYAVFGRESFWPAEVVGTKKPNPFGLRDMHGNADEWCLDWHDSEFFAKSPQDDPVALTNPTDKNSGRVARGGTSLSAPWWTRSTTRPWDFPATPNNPKGFRPALTVDSVRATIAKSATPTP